MGVGGIDLNLLVALRALLEDGNLTRAGERIGMRQPAMSTALARLRRHYDDELLVRVGRGFELTPLANLLLPSVQETLRLAEDALAVAPKFDPGSSDRAFSLMMSDYTVTVLGKPLLQRVSELAPTVRLDLVSPIPPDARTTDRVILDHDFLVAPLGYGFRWSSRFLYRDRFVCVVDPHNERIRKGYLSMEDLRELPHAVATFGQTNLTPADRVLEELRVERQIRVSIVDWLALPFAVAGTRLVALVPELLAHEVAHTAGVAVVEPPFGRVDLVEAVWWHPSRLADPGHQWLQSILEEVATSVSAKLSGRTDLLT